MDTIVNGIMKGLDYLNMREYLSRMVYNPENLRMDFEKEKRRINQMHEITESQIRNRKTLLKELENLVEFEDIKNRETYIKAS